MIPSIDERDAIACIPQHNEDGSTNLAWRRARLGCITGSECSNVMLLSEQEKALQKALIAGRQTVETKSEFNKRLAELKKKSLEEHANALLSGQKLEDEEIYQKRIDALKTAANENPFSQTALQYIFKVASERNMRDVFVKDDELFEEYMYRVDISSSTIRWGQETEDMARSAYVRDTGNEVTEVGFLRHTAVDWFGDSPDGLVLDSESGKPIGAIEIKCPRPETWMRYNYEFNKGIIYDCKTPNEVLKEIKPEYYWQCQAHCEVAGVDWVDFIFYDPSQKNGLCHYKITKDSNDILALIERVKTANRFIDRIIQ